MNCQTCGYAMTAFETNCARCKAPAGPPKAPGAVPPKAAQSDSIYHAAPVPRGYKTPEQRRQDALAASSVTVLSEDDDSVGALIGFALLTGLVPCVGVIFGIICFRQGRPRRANACLAGAFIFFSLGMIFGIVEQGRDASARRVAASQAANTASVPAPAVNLGNVSGNPAQLQELKDDITYARHCNIWLNSIGAAQKKLKDDNYNDNSIQHFANQVHDLRVERKDLGLTVHPRWETTDDLMEKALNNMDEGIDDILNHSNHIMGDAELDTGVDNIYKAEAEFHKGYPQLEKDAFASGVPMS